MKTQASFLFATAVLLAGTGGSAIAQQPGADLGWAEYKSSCAGCHGLRGKGDGPVVAVLSKPPPDLTTLGRRNGGVLPVQLVWEMIDGRTTGNIAAHGSREMPVWGTEYRAIAQLQDDPTISGRPEWYVRGRILALIDYLQRIQVK